MAVAGRTTHTSPYPPLSSFLPVLPQPNNKIQKVRRAAMAEGRREKKVKNKHSLSLTHIQ
jgi:hypothetical protein